MDLVDILRAVRESWDSGEVSEPLAAKTLVIDDDDDDDNGDTDPDVETVNILLPEDVHQWR